jgi:hypothetical protein
MNPAIDAASLFFVRHRHKARIRARRTAAAFPCMVKANIVAPEKQGQYRCLRRADCGVVSRVGRIRRIAKQRRPIHIRRRGRSRRRVRSLSRGSRDLSRPPSTRGRLAARRPLLPIMSETRLPGESLARSLGPPFHVNVSEPFGRTRDRSSLGRQRRSGTPRRAGRRSR